MAGGMDALVRRASEGRLDLPAALLMGAAAAALVMMAPIVALQNAVVASGLPELLPAAGPPLGGKARLMFAFATALIGFGAALLVLRAAGRGSGSRRPPRDPRDEIEDDFLPAPRVRRRDLHPDAPVRAPLMAARDLGEPGAPSESPLRIKRARLHEALAAAEVPVESNEPVPVEEEPVALSPVVASPEPPVEEEAIQAPPAAPSAAPRPEPAAVPEPAPSTPADRPETIAELLARLERALGSGERSERVASPPAARSEPAQANDPADDRLQAALASLKRFAPRAG